MLITAKSTYLHVGPRKLRLLTVGLRGLTPEAALKKLAFDLHTGTVELVKTIKQASANAINNLKLDRTSLTIDSIEVGDGPRIKRMDKSHGARFDRGVIQKRQSHLTVRLLSQTVAPATSPVPETVTTNNT